MRGVIFSLFVGLVLLTPLLSAQTLPDTVHYVVPQGLERTAGNTASGFPFDYSNYVRYQQAVDASALPGPGPLLGVAIRAKGWSTTAQDFWVEVRVLAGHTKLGVQALGSTYASNFSDQPVEVFRGRLNVVRPGTPAGGAFDVPMPFSKFFLYRGTDNLLLDFAPLRHSIYGTYGGGGGGRAFDFSRTAASMGNCQGKNGSQGIPTTGAFSGPGGFVLELWMTGGTVLGKGCSTGKVVPQAAWNGIPVRGNKIGFELNQAPVGSSAVLLLGYDYQQWGAIQLPLDLNPLGMTGCSLYLGIVTVLPATVQGTNVDQAWAYLPMTIPNSAALAGARLVFQWLLGSSGVNPAGLVTTRGVVVTIS